MIDEKDIRKAATLTHNPALDAVANFAARNAFAAGVEWFKKALWHEASEMPEKGKAFVFLAESNSLKHYHVGVVYNPMDYDKLQMVGRDRMVLHRGLAAERRLICKT